MKQTRTVNAQSHAGNYFHSPVAVSGLHERDNSNIIKIAGNDGSGKIRMHKLAEGLNIACWDLQLKTLTEFKRIPSFPIAPDSFTVICTLTPEHLLIRKENPQQNLLNIVFASGMDDIRFTILPGHRIKAIIINIGYNWLMQEYKEADADLLFLLHELVSQNDRLPFTEQASFSMHLSLIDMYDHAIKNAADAFCIKAKTLSVLYNILTRLQAQRSGEAPKSNVQIQSKMLAVEKILDGHLEKNLPGIQAIAKEVSLSESTLKRNFKHFFGVSIYEYYLQKKMQRAWQLFEERNVAVKEVAYMLGYEKTSNFIKIFKKYYSFSPGTFKKKFATVRDTI